MFLLIVSWPLRGGLVELRGRKRLLVQVKIWFISLVIFESSIDSLAQVLFFV